MNVIVVFELIMKILRRVGLYPKIAAMGIVITDFIAKLISAVKRLK